MVRAILFDLDNTLLGNPMSSFLPRYFQAIASHLSTVVDDADLMPKLLGAMDAVMANSSATQTNEKVYWDIVSQAVGAQVSVLQEAMRVFYRDVFPKLRPYTHAVPIARDVVEAAFANGYEVVIATNPTFPLSSILERLRWANIPSSDFNFAMITSFENMHFCKPAPGYFKQILATIDRAPDECVMVGDDVEWDMPAKNVGIWTYLVTDFLNIDDLLSSDLIDLTGTLAEFEVLLKGRMAVYDRRRDIVSGLA